MFHLILVMPAMNATSERSFSVMRRTKTYLNSTMSQERLNHVVLLHYHKDITDSLDLVAVTNKFVKLSSQRLSIFGKFTNEDYLPVEFCSRCKGVLNALK